MSKNIDTYTYNYIKRMLIDELNQHTINNVMFYKFNDTGFACGIKYFDGQRVQVKVIKSWCFDYTIDEVNEVFSIELDRMIIEHRKEKIKKICDKINYTI